MQKNISQIDDYILKTTDQGQVCGQMRNSFITSLRKYGIRDIELLRYLEEFVYAQILASYKPTFDNDGSLSTIWYQLDWKVK